MKRRSQFRESSTRLLKNPQDFKISKIDEGETLFEIGEILTTDLAEGISIMLTNEILVDDRLWKTKVTENIENVEPRRALYWLSGGDREWLTLENYNRNWVECEWDLQEKFGIILIEILKNSKTYGDIRKGFIEKISLSILYDFALSKNFIR